LGDLAGDAGYHGLADLRVTPGRVAQGHRAGGPADAGYDLVQQTTRRAHRLVGHVGQGPNVAPQLADAPQGRLTERALGLMPRVGGGAPSATWVISAASSVPHRSRSDWSVGATWHSLSAA
jgi:hypothetical protein